MAKPQDWTGRRFNRLVVLSFHHRDRKRIAHWLCRCDCGTEKVVCGASLTRGLTGNGVKSCGCLRNEWWSQCGGKVKPGAAFRKVLSRYKNHARMRGIRWELSDEQFKQLTSSVCFYTGRAPSYISKADSGEIYIYNGVDRLRNDGPYSWDNCVPCCGLINMMKKTLEYDTFIQLCREVYNTCVPAVCKENPSPAS